MREGDAPAAARPGEPNAGGRAPAPWEDPALLEGAGAAERECRAGVLAALARHVQEEGPHTARPSPHRARQFMPFAALEGYGDLIAEEEERAAARE